MRFRLRLRRRIGLHIRHSPRKVARSFPWPVFINLHKHCDSNDPTSAFARFIWTSHATFVGNHAGVRGLRDGAKPTPSHIHSYPTGTPRCPAPTRHPGLVPHPICPHSPNCTQPTDTPRCPAPTRHPGLVSAPLMRSKRRPPRPKHPTFAQFHRSGLHFGRIHPQHRQYGDSSKAYGIAAVSVSGGAWPDNEPTRRAKLAARTASGRAAAHGHTKQPDPAGARNTRGATSSLAQQLPDNGYDSETSPATTSPRGSRRARPR